MVERPYRDDSLPALGPRLRPGGPAAFLLCGLAPGRLATWSGAAAAAAHPRAPSGDGVRVPDARNAASGRAALPRLPAVLPSGRAWGALPALRRAGRAGRPAQSEPLKRKETTAHVRPPTR